ncbi:MAG: flagellar export chaperone FliS [Nitrospiraceae bacterium]|nr:flagellar export chaperone FliS [Nitrospiraceae bacterium]
MNTYSPTAVATQYRQTQVLTASGVQLIVLLYDSAIQATELASDGIARRHQPDKARFLGRAVAIVGELSNVLDFERGGEIAKSLYRIYDYMLSELTQANLRNDASRLDGPLRCLKELRGAWHTIAQQQDQSVPMPRG